MKDPNQIPLATLRRLSAHLSGELPDLVQGTSHADAVSAVRTARKLANLLMYIERRTRVELAAAAAAA